MSLNANNVGVVAFQLFLELFISLEIYLFFYLLFKKTEKLIIRICN